MKPILVASLLVITLAACGGPREEDVLTPDKIRASESAPELPEIQLSENPEPPPTPPPEQPELNEQANAAMENVVEIETQGTIPPAFQALWGQVPSDCRQGPIVGTGMMVREDGLTYADSAAQLEGVLGDYPGRFSGRFSYEGDIEKREDLVLTGNSNVLIRTSDGDRTIYHRCGATRPTG